MGLLGLYPRPCELPRLRLQFLDPTVDILDRCGELSTPRFVSGVLERARHFFSSQLKRFDLLLQLGVFDWGFPREVAIALEFFHTLLDQRFVIDESFS